MLVAVGHLALQTDKWMERQMDMHNQIHSNMNLVLPFHLSFHPFVYLESVASWVKRLWSESEGSQFEPH